MPDIVFITKHHIDIRTARRFLEQDSLNRTLIACDAEESDGRLSDTGKEGLCDGFEVSASDDDPYRHAAAAALFEGTSRSLADILAKADTAGGRPKGFALPGTARIAVTTKVRRYTTPAVIAMIEGSDPVLRNEYVATHRACRPHRRVVLG